MLCACRWSGGGSVTLSTPNPERIVLGAHFVKRVPSHYKLENGYRNEIALSESG